MFEANWIDIKNWLKVMFTLKILCMRFTNCCEFPKYLLPAISHRHCQEWFNGWRKSSLKNERKESEKNS